MSKYQSSMPTHCVRCGCGVVSISEHSAAGPEQREEWKADGVRRYHGRGLCATCAAHLRNHGGIEAYQPRSRRANTTESLGDNGRARKINVCDRCGVTQWMTSKLCDDCVLVLSDLAELDRWEQAS